MPRPFEDPSVVLPAKVLTKPLVVMARIMKFRISTTKSVPVGENAMPRGPLKLAAVPRPLEDPTVVLLPAKVLTKPLRVMDRIEQQSSEKKTVPSSETATPKGFKRAEVPCPSTGYPPPPSLPASVLTRPPGVMARTALSWVTNTVPSGDTATSIRLKKEPGMPSENPGVFRPAKVLTRPV